MKIGGIEWGGRELCRVGGGGREGGGGRSGVRWEKSGGIVWGGER